MIKPTNGFVNVLLTDLYQITMAYAYWKSGIAEKRAVFDLFFRSNPFGGSFTIFAGLSEVIRLLSSYKFSKDDLAYLKTVMPACEDSFFTWLSSLDCSSVTVSSMKEGSVVFPREPLLRVEGPLAVCQLLETTFLSLVNFPSLIATNAARYRLAAGVHATLIEFGLRRAQGPDGGVSASKYCYIGGFDGTSNVLAGRLFGVPVKGTHAHSFVQAFHGMDDLGGRHFLKASDGTQINFVRRVAETREQLGYIHTNTGELAALTAYALAFPDGFLALVDTYDTLSSGVPNFICVATALGAAGHKPIGIRLDSGDLAYLSREARRMIDDSARATGIDLSRCTITASNDINEDVLRSLALQGHAIDVFGIGTHLVTCQSQPALGCVYKLVEIEGSPRIKLSEQVEKVTLPGRKDVYRLSRSDGIALADIMVMVGEAAPEPGVQILCRHPYDEKKRASIKPEHVELLTECVWKGKPVQPAESIESIRKHVREQVSRLREDYLRPVNPSVYKVSVTPTLFRFIHELWAAEMPEKEIH
jgi:nicotinate phosphoribosyltransferase